MQCTGLKSTLAHQLLIKKTMKHEERKIMAALAKVDTKCILIRALGILITDKRICVSHFLIVFVCTFVPDYHLTNYTCFLFCCQVTHQGLNNTSGCTHCTCSRKTRRLMLHKVVSRWVKLVNASPV